MDPFSPFYTRSHGCRFRNNATVERRERITISETLLSIFPALLCPFLPRSMDKTKTEQRKKLLKKMNKKREDKKKYGTALDRRAIREDDS